MARTLPTDRPLLAAPALDVESVYDATADFAWRSLHRLGVDDRDLPDLLQEVYVVVHRRRDDYDPSRPLHPWIWGICVGLTRNYRRRAARSRERLMGALPERASLDRPDTDLERRRRRERGARLLEALEPEKRAVFIMFEVEGMSGRQIAELLGLPLGTVHSRLHAARRELAAALEEGER
ncbi:MAG: sigma-70 family RNA polymerase sigma factor [Sandaracinaceae bacterium]|nr:sigma-70 family RNA polymerase sigma factor [Sandaracinaceae bacterium]